jgi:hypothetical protein
MGLTSIGILKGDDTVLTPSCAKKGSMNNPSKGLFRFKPFAQRKSDYTVNSASQG